MKPIAFLKKRVTTKSFSYGFSIIELLFVVSIVALLATVMLTSMTASRNKSRDAKVLRDLREIGSALDLYALDNGNTYPITPSLSTNISSLSTSLVSGSKKYISSIQTLSPVNLPYRYVRCTASGVNGYALFAFLNDPKPIQTDQYTRVRNLTEPCLGSGDVTTYIPTGYNYVLLRK